MISICFSGKQCILYDYILIAFNSISIINNTKITFSGIIDSAGNDEFQQHIHHIHIYKCIDNIMFTSRFKAIWQNHFVHWMLNDQKLNTHHLKCYGSFSKYWIEGDTVRHTERMCVCVCELIPDQIEKNDGHLYS